jgi:hypothetical protein
MPGADFATEYANNGEKNAWTVNQGQVVSGKEFTSGSVWGILKDGNDQNDARGKLSIYANAYIMIDGVAHMASDENNSNGTVQSLYSVMQKLDAQYSTLGDKQQAVKDFYTTWRDVMSGWNLTNLENAVSAA